MTDRRRITTNRQMPMRRGFSLIEMIVVITIGSVLMGVALSLLLALLGAERNGRSHAEQSESIRRLADQFRRDAHAATGKSAISSQKNGCRIVFPDNTAVVYVCDGNILSRQEIKDKKIVRNESYTLPKKSSAAIAVDPWAIPSMLSLTISADDGSKGAGRFLRIDAALGRDQRFHRAAEGDMKK